MVFNPLCAQVVSDAAGQGVTITGSETFNNWNWPNAVIFAATVITTIGKYISTASSDSSPSDGSLFIYFLKLYLNVQEKVTNITVVGKKLN